MPTTHQLIVFMQDRRIGTLTSRNANHVELVYDDGVIEDPAAVSLSLTLPLAGRRHRGASLNAWLRGLLPDRSEVLQRWRREFGVRRLDDFSLLWHVGEDVAGAAMFVRPERLDAVTEPGTLLPISSDDIARRLRTLRTDQAAWGPSPGTGQFSLAGAQAKFALHATSDGWAEASGSIPSTHILKPSIPNMLDQDVCEHLTMRTAANLGLAVPQTSLETFEDQRALVVQRFDRARIGDRWIRVHQEDMCQAAGTMPGNKYEEQGGPGAARIVSLLRSAVGQTRSDTEVHEFLRSFAFNWLVVGTDAHAKNYAVLYGPRQARLAPLYDLNSYIPYRTPGTSTRLSMKVGSWQYDADRIRAHDWEALAHEIGSDPDNLITSIHEMAARLPDAARDAASLPDVTGLTSPIPALMIDGLASRAAECMRWLRRANTNERPRPRAIVCQDMPRNRPPGWNAWPLVHLRVSVSIAPGPDEIVDDLLPEIRDDLMAGLANSPITPALRQFASNRPGVCSGPERLGAPDEPMFVEKWSLAQKEAATPQGDQIIQSTTSGVYRLGTDGRAGVTGLLTVRGPSLMTGNHLTIWLDLGLSLQDGVNLIDMARLLCDGLSSVAKELLPAVGPMVPGNQGTVRVELHWEAPSTVDSLNRPVPERHGIDFSSLGDFTRGSTAYGGYAEQILIPTDEHEIKAFVIRAIEKVALDAGFVDPRAGLTRLRSALQV